MKKITKSVRDLIESRSDVLVMPSDSATRFHILQRREATKYEVIPGMYQPHERKSPLAYAQSVFLETDVGKEGKLTKAQAEFCGTVCALGAEYVAVVEVSDAEKALNCAG